MFKVECPGCKASYNVDERRVPAGTGMKMRCPKCTTTFQVKRPDESSATPFPSAPPPAPAPAPAPKPVTVASSPKTRKATVIGLGEMMPGLPATPGASRGVTATAPPDEEDLLPAMVMPKGRSAAPAIRETPAPLDEIDLPSVAADLPAARGARSRTAAASDDLDLPSSLPGLDLPSPVGGVGLPARVAPGSGSPAAMAKSGRQITGGVLFDDIDLPGVGADLPAARGTDLPAIKTGAALPAIKGAGARGGFGEIDLPSTAAALPAAAAALPAAAAGLPMTKGPGPTIGESAFGDDFDFDEPPPPPKPQGLGRPREPSIPEFGAVKAPPLPAFGAEPEEDDPFQAPAAPGRGAPALPPAAPAVSAAAAAAAAPLRRQSGGGTNFGEVDLGDDGGSFGEIPETPAAAAPPRGAAPQPSGWGDRDLGGEDDMEFEAIPQEKEEPKKDENAAARPASVAPPSAPSGSEPRRTGTAAVITTAKPSGKPLRVAAILATVVVLGGGALQFTPLGPFGMYAIGDALHAKDYEALRVSTLQQVRDQLNHDTSMSASKALELAEASHAQQPRAQGVTAIAAYAAYAKELRFGHDAAQHAHANTLLANVSDDPPPPGYELAKSAQAAASDQLARGQNQIEAYLRRTPNDIDALALAAEIALLARDSERATAHWTKLSAEAPSPRALFGLARAHLLKKDSAAAKDAAQKAATQDPKHVGALLLLAQIAWDNNRDETSATKYLDQIIKLGTDGTSKEELVLARTLTGQIHLNRSRVSAAEAAFGEALKLNPKASGALNGMGEALFRAGRFAEALARFGSAMEADPEAIDPKLGVAKTKLALERLQEAKELMRGLDKKLRDDNKPNFRVIHWKGRVSEAFGDKNAAEADYNEAIKLAGENPDVVDSYVAIAQLLYSQGRSAEAQSKLDEAKAKLPKSVPLFKALGDLASQAGRYQESEAHYLNALQMDPLDISTRFRLGTILRRLGKFDAAGQAFDKVTEADKDYPGLALERAVLYEASGQSSKAVELYESALAKAPNDPDLMLRVAAALLAANQPGQLNRAEELLRKVMLQRQNSAEANHFLGRALLMKGTNLADALRYLRRAADLDPNRAEFFLYVGWAANAADDQQLAGTSLAKALDFDKSLADAYWQRGVLRRRQRALADAEQDLLKALELRPSRYEAYATLAEVYEDQQKWPAAQTAWQKAISADGKNPYWHFRLGKLITQHGSRTGSLDHLSQAVQLASQNQSPPSWMADACFLLGEAEQAAGKKDLAKEHFQRFLSLAPNDSPYRADAEKALKAMGANQP